jgi:hypothetical protein
MKTSDNETKQALPCVPHNLPRAQLTEERPLIAGDHTPRTDKPQVRHHHARRGPRETSTSTYRRRVQTTECHGRDTPSSAPSIRTPTFPAGPGSARAAEPSHGMFPLRSTARPNEIRWAATASAGGGLGEPWSSAMVPAFSPGLDCLLVPAAGLIRLLLPLFKFRCHPCRSWNELVGCFSVFFFQMRLFVRISE